MGEKEIHEYGVAQYTFLTSSLLSELENYSIEIKRQRKELKDNEETLKGRIKRLWQLVEEKGNALLAVELGKNKFSSDIKSLIEEEDITTKSIADYQNQMSDMMIEKKMLERDRDEKKETALKEYQALIKAMAYHKQYLKCYIDLEDADLMAFTFHFFCKPNDKKTKSSSEYFVCLNYSDGKWKAMEMKPSLSCEEEITKHLEETGDIQGFLSHAHDLYCKHRKQAGV